MSTKNFKTFGTKNTERVGIYNLNSYNHYLGDNKWLIAGSQSEYLAPGTYSWVCPPGVTSVHVVCVGAGGGGGAGWANSGGSGGGLGWKNNIAVTPGQSYTVQVGNGGNRGANAGTNSYFNNLQTVAGYGGAGQGINTATQGSYVGDGGGNGGNGTGWNGGAGAGGYSGNGGDSNQNAATNSGAAAGGASYSSTWGTGAGGGTGIYGIRTDYDAVKGVGYGATTGRGGTTTKRSTFLSGLGGEGGSQRTGIVSNELTGYHGCNGENTTYSHNSNNIHGGYPGGGGGGAGTSAGGGPGADGAVRIMWSGEGPARSYPSTNTEDIQ